MSGEAKDIREEVDALKSRMDKREAEDAEWARFARRVTDSILNPKVPPSVRVEV